MLESVFGALTGAMLEGGVSVYEACQILRLVAVRFAGSRMLLESGRKSHSQISAMTGLSRAEVARLTKTPRLRVTNQRLSQNPIQKVLAAWYDSPAYLTKQGDPIQLPIFGPRVSFERLVKKVGSGVPVRAMLDEMSRIGAIDLLPDQKVRIKARIAVNRGQSQSSIRQAGVRATDLIRTLTQNLTSDSPLFEASVSTISASEGPLPMLKREIGNRSSSFLGNIDVLLKMSTSTTEADSPASNRKRIGIGVYYFEQPLSKSPPTVSRSPRTNLKRRRTNRQIQE